MPASTACGTTWSSSQRSPSTTRTSGRASRRYSPAPADRAGPCRTTAAASSGPVTGSARATTRHGSLALRQGRRRATSAVQATPVSTVRSRSGASASAVSTGPSGPRSARVPTKAATETAGCGGSLTGRPRGRRGAPGRPPRRRRARCARRATSRRGRAALGAQQHEVVARRARCRPRGGAPRASCAARGGRSPPPPGPAAWRRRPGRRPGRGTAATYVASASGSREAAWSGPGRVRSVVTCFSSTDAPSATAPRALVSPVVWSDQPTGRPWAPRHRRDRPQVALLEGRGVGRDAVEEDGARGRARTPRRPRRPRRPTPCRWRRAAAPRSAASSRRNGVLVSSPDDTLRAGTPSPTRSSALPRSNGVLRNWVPALGRVVAQLGPHRRGQGQRREERVLVGRGPAGPLVGRRVGRGGDQPVGVEGLELHGIRPGVGRDVDEPVRERRGHRRG